VVCKAILKKIAPNTKVPVYFNKFLKALSEHNQDALENTV
jgi:hypothetical protein